MCPPSSWPPQSSHLASYSNQFSRRAISWYVPAVIQVFASAATAVCNAKMNGMASATACVSSLSSCSRQVFTLSCRKHVVCTTNRIRDAAFAGRRGSHLSPNLPASPPVRSDLQTGKPMFRGAGTPLTACMIAVRGLSCTVLSCSYCSILAAHASSNASSGVSSNQVTSDIRTAHGE